MIEGFTEWLAIGISIVSIATSGFCALFVALRRERFDQRLEALRAEQQSQVIRLQNQFERELAEQRARLERRAEFAAEAVAHKLLRNSKWSRRSFDAIKGYLGGFEDDQLRQILVQAGAVRLENRDKELWGLIERNMEQIEG